MAIKKSQLYSMLWESCNQLRGDMDASLYKNYVLALLFVKYMSDKHIAVNYVQTKSRTKAANECWKIVVAIHHDETISTPILAEHTGLSLRSIKNYTKALQQANIIEYVREEVFGR